MYFSLRSNSALLRCSHRLGALGIWADLRFRCGFFAVCAALLLCGAVSCGSGTADGPQNHYFDTPDGIVDEFGQPYVKPKCIVAQCNDDNPCTTDTCNPQVGCSHVALANGTACSDTLACTTGDTCQFGQCGVGALGKIALGEASFGSVVPLADGGAIASGTRWYQKTPAASWTHRVDSAGQVLWHQDWAMGTGFSKIVTMVSAGDATNYVVGTSTFGAKFVQDYQQGQIWAARIGDDGAVLWQSSLQPQDLAGTVTAAVQETGELWVLAYSMAAGEGTRIVRVSAQGAVLGTLELPSPVTGTHAKAGAMANVPGGGVLLIGQIVNSDGSLPSDTNVVWRVDKAGQVLGVATLLVDQTLVPVSVAADQDGWYAGGYVRESYWITRPVLCRFDHNGKLLWRTIVRSLDSVYIAELVPKAGGRVAAMISQVNKPPLHLYEWDSSGALRWATDTGLSSERSRGLVAWGNGWRWTDVAYPAENGAGPQLVWVRADPWGHDSCAGAGVCADLQGSSCSDSGVCTEALCTPKSGCATVSAVCDDGNPCTFDSCDVAAGCTATAAADSTGCDDGNPCTEKEACHAGVCGLANGATPCQDDNPCSVDTCMPSGCEHKYAADGTPCDDGQPCTPSSACKAGFCGYAGLWHRDLLPQQTGEVAGLIALPDDGLMVVGTATQPGSLPSATAVGLDAIGTVQWTRVMDPQAGLELRAAAQLSDGAVVAVGAAGGQGVVVRWPQPDAPGQWLAEPAWGLNLAEAVTPAASGYWLAGRHGSEFWLERRDTLGTLLWQKVLAVPGALAVDALAANAAGEVVVALQMPYVTPGVSDLQSCMVLRLAADGTVVWQSPAGPGQTRRWHALAFSGANVLAAGHSGWIQDFEQNATFTTIDGAGKQGQNIALESGQFTGLFGHEGQWQAVGFRVGKSPSDWRAIAVPLQGPPYATAVELLPSGGGKRLAARQRQGGWDVAAAHVTGKSPVFAWQVARVSLAGSPGCP